MLYHIKLNIIAFSRAVFQLPTKNIFLDLLYWITVKHWVRAGRKNILEMRKYLESTTSSQPKRTTRARFLAFPVARRGATSCYHGEMLIAFVEICFIWKLSFFTQANSMVIDGSPLHGSVTRPNRRIFVGRIPKSKRKEELITEFEKVTGKFKHWIISLE